MTKPVYIPDIIGQVVQSASDSIYDKKTGKTLLEALQENEASVLGSSLITQIRYSKSSFDELIETLAQADPSIEERYKKYPLVHLVRDINIERGGEPGYYGIVSLNIIFAHQTEQTYKIDERDEKVFKPVLYPLYYSFLDQLEKSGWTSGTYDSGEYRHTLIERAFWGNRKLQGSENILNDYVDALEVRNLRVKINFENCKF